MLKVQIKKDGVVTHESKFETQEQVDAWVAQNEQVMAFGQPTWVEDIPEQVDEQGNVVVGAHQIVHPADYVVEVTDITAQVQDEMDSAKDAKAEEQSSMILQKIRKVNRAKIRAGLWDTAKVRSLKANAVLMQMKEDIRDGFFGIALVDLNAADVSEFYSADEKMMIMGMLQAAHIATT